MKTEHIKQFILSLSFRELTLVTDFAVTIGIGYYYLTRLLHASTEMQADAGFVSWLLFKVIIVSIVLASASRLVLWLVSDGELDQPLDEREKLISLTGNKYALWILQMGIGIAIFQYTAEAHGWGPDGLTNVPFLPLHIMVMAFVLSDASNYVMQIVKGRDGDIYG